MLNIVVKYRVSRDVVGLTLIKFNSSETKAAELLRQGKSSG